jgi:hypothetical protein
VAELDAYPDESFAAKQKTRLEKKTSFLQHLTIQVDFA